jgi:hypothetical protein
MTLVAERLRKKRMKYRHRLADLSPTWMWIRQAEATACLWWVDQQRHLAARRMEK